jgi:hypothetical protein
MNWLSVGLACLLFLQPMAPPVIAQTTPDAKLRIVVLGGEAGINNLHQRAGRDVIVRVEDEAQKPVAGAVVVFTLPSEGPSGTLPGGSKTLTVPADEEGKAVMRGMIPNQVAGKMEIRVSTSHRGQTARVVVTQFNMNVPKAAKSGGSGKLIAVLVLVGAAAAGGTAAAMLNKNGTKTTAGVSTGPTPIGITPGTGTFGPPQGQ